MILRILGGKHMVDPSMVRVLGRSAFHDTALTGFGDLSYLGGEWRRDVAFAGFDVPIQMNVPADKLINRVAGIDPQRRAELIKVLLLDEITVDLDVLARADLLQFLRKECEERGAMIVSQAPNWRESETRIGGGEREKGSFGR
ncbi:ABC transporter I family member 20-like [Rosa rugosa]|uniref:ABC transporter I family member 20-like n=1 Tax=Rosa rugosa TaxID=74645 RepID=UPI002B401E50|nr:ABC transporter I family member 20-like [Rosa rugosa]